MSRMDGNTNGRSGALPTLFGNGVGDLGIGKISSVSTKIGKKYLYCVWSFLKPTTIFAVTTTSFIFISAKRRTERCC